MNNQDREQNRQEIKDSMNYWGEEIDKELDSYARRFFHGLLLSVALGVVAWFVVFKLIPKAMGL